MFVHYTVQCHYPLNIPPDESVTVTGFRDPALLGSLLQFRCKVGLVPSNMFTAMCLEDGKWYPDPTKHNCTLGMWYIPL